MIATTMNNVQFTHKPNPKKQFQSLAIKDIAITNYKKRTFIYNIRKTYPQAKPESPAIPASWMSFWVKSESLATSVFSSAKH